MARPVLSLKAVGADVAELQALLIKRGYALESDGKFGKQTQAAVVDLQEKNGLTADGIVGPKTWECLGTFRASAVKTPAAPIAAGEFEVVGHRLRRGVVPVPYRESPNGSGVIKPQWLVIHFTAGFYAGDIAWMTQPGTNASAHLCISDEGHITQLAPLNRRCYHAGVSSWKGKSQLNSSSIGFELSNLGQLNGSAGSYRFGKHKVPDARVIRAAHRNGGPVTPWHTFTKVQIEAAAGAARAVCAAYGITEIVGHDDIAPKRKSDPGPAFDMPAFRRDVLG